MKKLSVFLLSIVVVIGGLIIWQKDNIEILVNTQKFTTEELQQSYISEKAKLEEKLKEEIENPIRDFTEEELELAKTDEYYAQNLINSIKEEAKSKAKDKVSSKQEIVNESLGSLYSLKASMIGSLDSLLSQAKSEYLALPVNSRTMGEKMNIAQKYISKGLAMEKSSDAKVNTILKNLENKLKINGESTSIVVEIKAAYNSEKSARKAYYLSLIK